MLYREYSCRIRAINKLYVYCYSNGLCGKCIKGIDLASKKTATINVNIV